jgi:hypothetical protein
MKEYVYGMIETLLPKAKVDEKGFKLCEMY